MPQADPARLRPNISSRRRRSPNSLPSISPQPPKEIIDAARALKYRDFILVALIVKDRGKFDDNWIYVHDPAVKVGRIQNFKSWSPEMSPEGGYTRGRCDIGLQTPIAERPKPA